MKRMPALFFLILLSSCGLAAREFTVLTYNVENLFDVDGVAVYPEYAPAVYGRPQLLNKLEGIRATLAAFNDGQGPEVVMFQEFELDRTPYGTPGPAAFLETTRGRSLAEVLAADPDAANLPAELLLLKYLDDHGLRGYAIAQPDPARMENQPAHKNVIFSRFPVREARQRPMLEARDLLVAVLDVEGNELVLLNNHWKSGASDPGTEGIRVQNARVVRAEVDAILHRNPRAELVIAGDLNSNYNQKAVFGERMPVTGVNDVLGAAGFESAMADPAAASLYNLWYELPREQRGSEVWRGRWGTLMQMILAPGLYDNRGIQYVDNSFNRLMLPGRNMDSRAISPVPWTNYGGGAGCSDHLPVYARFRVVDGGGADAPMALDNPTDEESSAFQPFADYRKIDPASLPDVAVLATQSPPQRARQLKELFRVRLPLVAADPPRVQVGDDLLLEIYCPIRQLRERLDGLPPGQVVDTIAELDDYRGQLQLVIQDTTWLRQP